MSRLRVSRFTAAALVLAACAPSTGTTTTAAGSPTTAVASTTATTASPATVAEEDPRPLRGFSLSPLSYGEVDFPAFFELAASNGDIVERVADALEWEEEPGAGVTVVQGLAEVYGYEPVSVGGIFDVANGDLIRPLDQATFDRYVAAAAGFAERHEPRYLGLGVEIDTQWRAHPDDFDRFVELFAAFADAVHGVSPDTVVFTVFQLERLSGMQGGVFGGQNDPSLAVWELIDRFPDADAIGFTTYPGLVYSDPDEIPEDYYSRLGQLAGGRPIVFTEMGWQAEGAFGPYSGTPEKQAGFVERFGELIAEVDVAFYVWSFLYDQDIDEPFASMGLIGSDGTERPGWTAWVAGG